jgi:hypothetical protein
MGTQQKTISWPLIIHPSWCTGGCWFTVARQLQVVPKHPKKQQLMHVSRWHKTNCLDKRQLRSLTSHGAMVTKYGWSYSKNWVKLFDGKGGRGGTLFLQSLRQLTTLKRIRKLKIRNHRHQIRGINLPKLLTLGIIPIDVICEHHRMPWLVFFFNFVILKIWWFFQETNKINWIFTRNIFKEFVNF